MKKAISLLATVAGLALMSPAFAAEDVEYKAETKVEKDADGDMHKETTRKLEDASGTQKSTHESDLDVDDDGNFEKTDTNKKVNDPDGLFNKSTTKTESTIKREDGVTTLEKEKKVNGDTVEHTKEEVGH